MSLRRVDVLFLMEAAARVGATTRRWWDVRRGMGRARERMLV
jgi:hypothetical protein